MVDYTWVANLLREIESFAVDNKLTGLSENLALACVALISDTEDKATISPDARQWLEKVGARKVVPDAPFLGTVVAFPRC